MEQLALDFEITAAERHLEGCRAAYAIGVARYDNARRSGLVNPRDCHGGADRWRRNDGLAAVAEWTVADRLGRAWTAGRCVTGKDNGEDVAGGVQVKWTRTIPPRLIIQADDRPDLNYALVIGTVPPLEILGWATFAEATRREYWRARALWPAFFYGGPFHAIETIPFLRGGYAESRHGDPVTLGNRGSDRPVTPAG